VARGRGLGRATQGPARASSRSGSDRLVKSLRGLGQRGLPRGGSNTGPNPTDRGKSGTKHHILVDREGLPLTALQSGANIHDSVMFEEVVDAVKPIKGAGRGRPRKRPEKLHADKAYDSKRCRGALGKRGIKVRIARKGIESSERLGRYRWVVERTISWLHRNRRLSVRHERRDDTHQAFLYLGCSLICWNQVQRLC
jgi:transposase